MGKLFRVVIIAAAAVAANGCRPDTTGASASAELPREWRVFQGIPDRLALPETRPADGGPGPRLIEAPAFLRLDSGGVLRVAPGARMPLGGHRVVLELGGERVELRVHVQPVV